MPSRSALGQSFFGAMQVTHVFCLQKRSLFSDEVFPLDILSRKMERSFAAQILLTRSDVTFDEPA
jgi:hypothetical protein